VWAVGQAGEDPLHLGQLHTDLQAPCQTSRRRRYPLAARLQRLADRGREHGVAAGAGHRPPARHGLAAALTERPIN
jgi:hypothetical protein